MIGLLVFGSGAAWLGLEGLGRWRLREVERALERHDLVRARSQLSFCLAVWPGRPAVQFRAARVFRRADAYDDAERCLAACEKLQGVTPETALERALLSAQRGDLAQVEATLRDAVHREDPQSAAILEALAKGYLARFELPHAVDCANALLERDPGHVPALRLRARCWEELHQPGQAVQDYEQILASTPEADDARLGLAEQYLQLGHLREAVAHYEVLRQRPDTDPRVLLGLARCKSYLRELTQARELLDALLQAQPDSVPALVERGRLSFQEGNDERAEEDLRRAVTLAAHDRDAQLLLTRCLEARGKAEEARKHLAEADRIEKDLIRVHSLKVQLAPEELPGPGVASEIGTILLRLGRDQEGLEWLARALRADARHGPTHEALADYFAAKGRPELAARHRRQAER